MRPHLSRAAFTTVIASVLVLAVVLTGLLITRGGSSDRPTGTSSFDPAAEAVLAREPDNPQARVRLANAVLSKARETGDTRTYEVAEAHAFAALDADPESFAALDVLGEEALGHHEFAKALEFSRRSTEIAPGRLAPLGIAGDALIELGRYEEGFATIERRLALKPDLAGYSRGSYARELVGDRNGALMLMRLAADAGAPGTEQRTWALVQLGLLRFRGGDLAGARADLRRALAERPGDVRALAAMARLQAAHGDLDAAAAGVRQALSRAPLPEHAAALAEIEDARGDARARSAALARFDALRRSHGHGPGIDIETAIVEADFGTPDDALVEATRRARDARPSIHGDQALGWVLTRAGRCDEALAPAARSLRLGTRDPLLLFHAGMASACAGEPEQARTRLRAALEMNPRFSVRWAPVAERELARLGA